MKTPSLLLALLALSPAVSLADDIPAGLWEVIGYPKSVQITTKSKKQLLPVSAQDLANRAYLTPMQDKIGTIDFTNDANTAKFADNTLVMNVCVVADKSWYEVNYGTQKGKWLASGSNLTFSGNDDTTGGSGVLSIVDPKGSLSGDWQQWPVSAPNTQQDVFSTLWTFKGASCS